MNADISAEWLITYRDSRPPPQGQQVTATDGIPPRFKAYIEIFHPMFEDADFPDRSITWTEWERRHRTATQIDELPTQPGSLAHPSGAIRRVPMKELAERFSVPLDESFWDFLQRRVDFGDYRPRYLLGREEGLLHIDIRRRLTEILVPWTQGSVYVYYEPWVVEFVGGDSSLPHLFVEPLPQLGELREHPGYEYGPTYVWEESRRWVLWTDYDLGSSFFGGPEEAAVLIVNDELIDAADVTAKALTKAGSQPGQIG
jgi:hypothetical protein